MNSCFYFSFQITESSLSNSFLNVQSFFEVKFSTVVDIRFSLENTSCCIAIILLVVSRVYSIFINAAQFIFAES